MSKYLVTLSYFCWKHPLFLLAFILGLGGITVSGVKAADTAPQLMELSNTTALKQVKASDVKVVSFELVENALQFVIKPAKGYPGISIIPADGKVWDLAKYKGVEAVVANIGDKPVSLVIRADNAGDWKKSPWNMEKVIIPAGEEKVLRLRFGYSWGKPGYALDAAKVSQVMFFTGKTDIEEKLRLKKFAPYGTATVKKASYDPANPPARFQMLDFNSEDFAAADTTQNNSKATKYAGTDGGLQIVTLKGTSWPGVNIPSPDGRWDLSPFGYISLDIHNLDNHDLEVFVRVDNPGANGHDHCITERIGVQPDQRVTINIPLKRNSGSDIKLFGMRGYPQGLYAGGAIDPSNIVAVTVFTAKNDFDTKFVVNNLYAAGKYEKPAWLTMSKEDFFPFIDEFGQFIHKDWPGKIKSAEELKQNAAAEAKILAADKGPKDWNKWGGWANGPQLEAKGHFYTTKQNGKWWLVDPDGKLFFSTGLCVVSTGGAQTPVEDRDNWFRGLPGKEEKPQFYNKTWKQGNGYYAGRAPLCYNFSASNLEKKYGEDWKEIYPEIVHQRLRHWGINTIGNWSQGNIMKMEKTPYTLTFFYNCPRLMKGKYGFPDVFWPKFRDSVKKGAEQFLKSTIDDPWCIGYFLDNEMPWGGDDTLALKSLASPADQDAKKELQTFLQKRYTDIAALNKAWGTDYAGWDAFLSETKKKPSTAAGNKDLAEFNDYFSETYYKTVKEVIREFAPNKLYLGCRAVGGSINTMKIAAKYCDVVSYNRYCNSVRDIRLPGGVDAPVIVGEFHFGALDRGLFWGGLVTADNQKDRGDKYSLYVKSALDNPQIVGVHWFQYGDEATSARGDGENGQTGFVDVCDTPYKETVEASRMTAEEMYPYREKAKVE